MTKWKVPDLQGFVSIEVSSDHCFGNLIESVNPRLTENLEAVVL